VDGYAREVPGLPEPLQAEVLSKGTVRTLEATAECPELDERAATYAKRYNAVILAVGH
jgi:hypothetical protein